MLDPRLRQLHDEPRSGGNQSAHQRMINRRFNDRASCFAQRRLYCEGNAKKGGEDFLRLLLETANIRVPPSGEALLIRVDLAHQGDKLLTDDHIASR